MKNSIKYLLLTAIVGFTFLNVFSKKSEKHERLAKALPAQTMPQIPNGDFEEWHHSGVNAYELKVWKTNSCPLCRGPINKYTIKPDTIIVYHGKYSAKFTGGHATNKFPISIHPLSLHGYVKCEFVPSSNSTIKVELLKKGIVVDSGVWRSERSIKEWTEINIPITNNTTEIDSALITIRGGVTSWVDDLFFK